MIGHEFAKQITELQQTKNESVSAGNSQSCKGDETKHA